LAVTAVLTAGLVYNLGEVRTNADSLRDRSDLVQAELGALELARGRANPDVRPFGPQLALFGGEARAARPPGAGGQGWAMRASEYFVIARDYGSPADSPQELGELGGEPAGQAADLVLAGGLGLRLRPASPEPPSSPGPAPTVKSLGQGTAEAGGSCVRLAPRDGKVKAAITLPPGGAWLAGATGSKLQLSRFFALPSVPLQPLPSPAAELRIPGDSAPTPWTLWVDSPRPLRVCGA
jgi:hypothetical protein